MGINLWVYSYQAIEIFVPEYQGVVIGDDSILETL